MPWRQFSNLRLQRWYHQLLVLVRMLNEDTIVKLEHNSSGKLAILFSALTTVMSAHLNLGSSHIILLYYKQITEWLPWQISQVFVLLRPGSGGRPGILRLSLSSSNLTNIIYNRFWSLLHSAKLTWSLQQLFYNDWLACLNKYWLWAIKILIVSVNLHFFIFS